MESNNLIIPDSDEEGKESRGSFEEQPSYSSTSSVSVNVSSVDYQRDLDGSPNRSDSNNIPPDVLDEARQAEERLIPPKSKEKYQQQYTKFKTYLNTKKIKVINETVLLGYFNMLSRERVPGSLWTIHSMLKGTLLTYDSIDISSFLKVSKFLSANEKASKHEKKKADTFTPDEIAKFLFDAPDYTWLAAKVALIIGLHGACRICELHNLGTRHVEDHNTCLKFNLVDTKNGSNRSFTVTGEFCTTIKRYMALRPPKSDKKNFFMRYTQGKCVNQVIGIHKIAEIPSTIAGYLNLPNPEKYTGHSFRRTGATIAANGGLDFINLKKMGGWASSAVAEGYIDSSLAQKNKISALISSTITKSAPLPTTGLRKTPLLVSTFSTPVRPRPSTSNEEIQIPASKKMRVNAELDPSTTDERVLRENPMNMILGPQLDKNQNIQIHFHNCTGFNFFGNHNKENPE